MTFSILGIRLKNSKDEINLKEDDKPDYKNLDDIMRNEIITLSCIEEVNLDINNHDELCEDTNEYESSSEDCEYDLYSKIETHMSISASLYILNRQGIDILKNIEKNKLIKSITNTSVQRVYNEIECFINQNRLSNDLYTNLISNLDDVMFVECGELESFYVKEDEYKLESLYYKQGSWVDEIDWEQQQQFSFSKSVIFDEGDCMYLLMYVNKYLKLLSRINNDFDNIKLNNSVNKLKDKMRNVHFVVSKALQELIGNDGNT
jgi:hypothetical protein